MGDVWPKTFYHVECREGRKFYSEAEIPEGWISNPFFLGHKLSVPLTPLPNWEAEEITPKRGRPRKATI